MRYITSLLLTAAATTVAIAEDQDKAPAAEPAVVVPPAPASRLSIEELQNLVILARRQLPNVPTSELQSAVISIRDAEEEIVARRQAMLTPPKVVEQPVENKKP